MSLVEYFRLVVAMVLIIMTTGVLVLGVIALLLIIQGR